MSGYELLIEDINGQLFAAVIKKTVLDDLYADHKDMAGCWGSIYVAKVSKVDKNLDAAIVDLGNGVQGLLQAKHVHFKGKPAKATPISDLLKPGQSVTVQIKSEAKRGSEHERNKLARVTMKLCMMGQFLLYSPVFDQVTISTQITDDAVLKACKKLKGNGGWIVEALANSAKPEQIIDEAEMMLGAWAKFQAMIEQGDTPRLISAGPNAIQRVLNDYGSDIFDHIYVADKNLLNIVMKWCAKHDPKLATSKRLQVFKPEKPGQKLFDVYDVYSELEALKENLILLRGGGSVIIEPTSAVTFIDVNQGSNTSIGSTNSEAALEIARQIRLRALSGAILIDFISTQDKNARFELQEKFAALFNTDHDTSGAQVHGFTRLGILEFTRKRKTASLPEKT